MRTAAWCSLKLLSTILLVGLLWVASTLATTLANLPSDIATIGSGLMMMAAVILFGFGLFCIWRSEIQKLKGFIEWLQD